jgi:hypothetical protein
MPRTAETSATPRRPSDSDEVTVERLERAMHTVADMMVTPKTTTEQATMISVPGSGTPTIPAAPPMAMISGNVIGTQIAGEPSFESQCGNTGKSQLRMLGGVILPSGINRRQLRSARTAGAPRSRTKREVPHEALAQAFFIMK